MQDTDTKTMQSECPLLKCLSIIGGAWTPSIIWQLNNGPRRFGELRADIPKISPKVLTTRLKELEAHGVVVRTVLATSPPSVEYSLNSLGTRLVPAIEAIAAVGEDLKAQRGTRASGSLKSC